MTPEVQAVLARTPDPHGILSQLRNPSGIDPHGLLLANVPHKLIDLESIPLVEGHAESLAKAMETVDPNTKQIPGQRDAIGVHYVVGHPYFYIGDGAHRLEANRVRGLTESKAAIALESTRLAVLHHRIPGTVSQHGDLTVARLGPLVAEEWELNIFGGQISALDAYTMTVNVQRGRLRLNNPSEEEIVDLVRRNCESWRLTPEQAIDQLRLTMALPEEVRVNVRVGSTRPDRQGRHYVSRGKAVVLAELLGGKPDELRVVANEVRTRGLDYGQTVKLAVAAQQTRTPGEVRRMIASGSWEKPRQPKPSTPEYRKQEIDGITRRLTDELLKIARAEAGERRISLAIKPDRAEALFSGLKGTIANEVRDRVASSAGELQGLGIGEERLLYWDLRAVREYSDEKARNQAAMRCLNAMDFVTDLNDPSVKRRKVQSNGTEILILPHRYEPVLARCFDSHPSQDGRFYADGFLLVYSPGARPAIATPRAKTPETSANGKNGHGLKPGDYVHTREGNIAGRYKDVVEREGVMYIEIFKGEGVYDYIPVASFQEQGYK